VLAEVANVTSILYCMDILELYLSMGPWFIGEVEGCIKLSTGVPFLLWSTPPNGMSQKGTKLGTSPGHFGRN
jgi:hypothetical protein